MAHSIQPFPLLDLPLDLLYALAKIYLDPVSSTALSLSCRVLHNTLLPTALKNLKTREEKIELLELLEKSTPSAVLCFACFKLHSTDERPTGLPASVFELGWSCKYAYAWTPSAPGNLGISFRDARAVMKETLPITALISHSTDPYCLAIPNSIYRPVTTQRDAKILGADLLVRYTYTFAIHALSTETIAQAIEDLKFGICHHTKVSGQSVLDAVAGVGDDLPQASEVEGRTWACRSCRADYAVSWGVRGGKEVVVVRSWHCFGEVRGPWGSEWGRATARRRVSVGVKGEEGEPEEGGVVQAMWESA